MTISRIRWTLFLIFSIWGQDQLSIWILHLAAINKLYLKLFEIHFYLKNSTRLYKNRYQYFGLSNLYLTLMFTNRSFQSASKSHILDFLVWLVQLLNLFIKKSYQSQTCWFISNLSESISVLAKTELARQTFFRQDHELLEF